MLKIFVSFTFLLILTDVVRCKPDYFFNHEANGWFKLHTMPATWAEAFLRCHYEGAVLASPLDEQLANALYTLLKDKLNILHRLGTRIFLGTHALFSKGDFFSVEGVPLNDMPINWGQLDPAADLEDCLTMNTAGILKYEMYTSSCTQPRPFICYKKLENETLNQCGTFDNKYHFDHRTGSCYKLHEDKQKWSRAYMICAAEGGYLVILNNEEEANIINAMFPVRDLNEMGEQMHTGLRAWEDDRTWLTIHGERIENVYNFGYLDQPDDLRRMRYCGSFTHDGTLVNADCDSRAIFVCEKDPNTTRYEPALIKL